MSTDLFGGIYSSPPPPDTPQQKSAALWITWMCTGISLAIIIARLAGRWSRTAKFFLDDKIIALSIVPLCGRMAVVYMLILYGTNNVTLDGITEDQIASRKYGSELVLAARLTFTAFIWISKLTISEFLKRTYSGLWKRSYEVFLQFIRYFLIGTFIIVIVADYTECQPYANYWQVVPDPGPRCRQGFIQLFVVGVFDIMTDVLLVAFPIPIIMASSMPTRRKFTLVGLFSLSLLLVIFTSYRLAATVQSHSNQTFRSLLASIEVLISAIVSNALVLSSFVRDKGAKKARFSYSHQSNTAGGSSLNASTPKKALNRSAVNSWGSDINLISDYGIRLGGDLKPVKEQAPRLAPAVLPFRKNSSSHVIQDRGSWTSAGETAGHMAFFDIGGLLGSDERGSLSPAALEAQMLAREKVEWASPSSSPPVPPKTPEQLQQMMRRTTPPLICVTPASESVPKVYTKGGGTWL